MQRLDTCDAAIMTAKDNRRGCGTEGQATTCLAHGATSTTWEYYCCHDHRNYARRGDRFKIMAQSLFGSALTSSAPAFGGFQQQQTQQSQAGITQTFGAFQPPQQQSQVNAQNSLQNVLQNITILTAAVSGPELFGDERDRIVALLNQLLASCGVGGGYYKSNAAAYNFTQDNPFHRLKGIGYNRLSKHKNTEGLVSLILKLSSEQLETSQQRLKLIDAVNNLLRNRPASTSMMGPAAPQRNPTAIHVEIKSIIPIGDAMTEVVIFVNESRRGIWPALELYNELMQTERANFLKGSLNCEKVVPRIEVGKEDLENYYKRPPAGFEEIWSEALRQNPDPENLVPYPIQGFQQLIQRQKMQKSVISAQNSALNEYNNRLHTTEHEMSMAHNNYTKCRQKQKQLSHRLLRVLATQTLIQRYGMMVDEKEEMLQCKLERISAELNAPDMIKSRILSVYDILRRDGDSLKQRIRQRETDDILADSDMQEIKRCLASRQALLEQLVESVKSSFETLKIIKAAKEKHRIMNNNNNGIRGNGEADSDSDVIDFEHELSSNAEDDTEPATIIPRKKRRMVDVPTKFSEVINDWSDIDEEKAQTNDIVKNEHAPNETDLFKVIGEENVSLTCTPRYVAPSCVNDAVKFSSTITDESKLSSIDSMPGIPDAIFERLQKNINMWFPVQKAVLPFLLKASTNVLPPRDVLITAPTGSGKTLCYIIPILSALTFTEHCNAVFGLIVAPVQGLAQQIYQEFCKYNVFGAKIALLNGTNEYDSERRKLFPNDDSVSHVHIIVATPGRLIEHLVDSSGSINLSSLRFLVIDEADRMIDTARIEWLQVVERRSKASPINHMSISELVLSKWNKPLQKVLVSATLSLDINQLHVWNLRCPRLFRADLEHEQETIKPNEGVCLPSTLTHKMVVCNAQMKPAILYYNVCQTNCKRIIVFVNDLGTAQRLARLFTHMSQNEFFTTELSSNIFPKRREKILKRFLAGEIRVLIATDVLSRGIDIEDVDCIINYNPPINEKIFLHRAGRTARAAKKGELISVVTKEERMRMKKMLLEINAWSENILDYRNTEKQLLGVDLLKKYEDAINFLKTNFQS
ncbi:DEAD/DEAH box helicase domain-containing protein [Ditylenchus destructor]|nr:DEAD/DEAH box helicase domain-containing protein [Ditylenchus destructor]